MGSGGGDTFVEVEEQVSEGDGGTVGGVSVSSEWRDMRTIEEGTLERGRVEEGMPVSEDVVEGGEGTRGGHGSGVREGKSWRWFICGGGETRLYVNGTCLSMSTIKHVLSTAPSYFVRRNSRGSLPVYSDIRNAGTRYLVQIRNVDGRVNVSAKNLARLCLTQPKDLAQDLRQSLFAPDSPHAQRLAVRVQHQRHIILSGGRFKRDVLAWLTAKDF